jgi:hypothetical protein
VWYYNNKDTTTNSRGRRPQQDHAGLRNSLWRTRRDKKKKPQTHAQIESKNHKGNVIGLSD